MGDLGDRNVSFLLDVRLGALKPTNARSRHGEDLFKSEVNAFPSLLIGFCSCCFLLVFCLSQHELDFFCHLHPKTQ